MGCSSSAGVQETMPGHTIQYDGPGGPSVRSVPFGERQNSYHSMICTTTEARHPSPPNGSSHARHLKELNKFAEHLERHPRLLVSRVKLMRVAMRASHD
mmetsp:Transcript_65521/g.153310  ORF Transcript_65521/g.153310 Transcript_65521/m.153310 type:complete len:99 (-) Transcript_65521:151-447(-)